MKTYAGFWQRMAAFMWDYLIIAGYFAMITILFWMTNAKDWLFTNRIQAQLASFLLLTLPVILYFSVPESSVQRATWGKRRKELIVVDHNGDQISFARAFVRTFLKFIPWEISHTLIWQISFFPQTNPVFINTGFAVVYLLIGLNIAGLLITKTHQTVYDLLANTIVEKQISQSSI